MYVRVVGKTQDGTIAKFEFKVYFRDKQTYKRLFCIDPSSFRISTFVDFKLFVFTPLYVKSVREKAVCSTRQECRLNERLVNEATEKRKKQVRTWLLCWNRMRWKEINKDVAVLIGKFILFFRFSCTREMSF